MMASVGVSQDIKRFVAEEIAKLSEVYIPRAESVGNVDITPWKAKVDEKLGEFETSLAKMRADFEEEKARAEAAGHHTEGAYQRLVSQSEQAMERLRAMEVAVQSIPELSHFDRMMARLEEIGVAQSVPDEDEEEMAGVGPKGAPEHVLIGTPGGSPAKVGAAKEVDDEEVFGPV